MAKKRLTKIGERPFCHHIHTLIFAEFLADYTLIFGVNFPSTPFDLACYNPPKAELKIFMTADNAVRVERRFRELYEKNPNITLDEVRHNLEMRDYIDSNREVSPLRKAADAIVLDNTHLTEKEQLEKALALAREKIGA